MLLYAWGVQSFSSHWRGAVEDAPTLDALLAGVLNRLIQQRLRIGLGRDYIPTQSELAGIRGRVQFTECIKVCPSSVAARFVAIKLTALTY